MTWCEGDLDDAGGHLSGDVVVVSVAQSPEFNLQPPSDGGAGLLNGRLLSTRVGGMEMSGLFAVCFFSCALCQPPGRVPLIKLAQAHMRGEREGGLCNCVSFLLQNANAMKIAS